MSSPDYPQHTGTVDTGRRVVDVFRLPAGDAVLVVTGVSDPVSIRLNSAQATLLAASLLTAVEAERLPPAMWLEDGAT